MKLPSWAYNKDCLAVDPGNKASGFVWFRAKSNALGGLRLLRHGDLKNAELRKEIRQMPQDQRGVLCIEMLKPRGMPTAFEELLTCFEVGRFVHEWAGRYTFIYRHTEKMTLCGNATVKDANIRQALIDRFGGESLAVGGKRCKRCKGRGCYGRQQQPCEVCCGSGWQCPPGPLHGIAGDTWAALAVACTWIETGTADHGEFTQQAKPQKKKKAV